MTKRLTIALVAVVLFVLMAIMPVSAANNVIDTGATIFIGEDGLNVTHALNAAYGSPDGIDAAPTYLTIGWWASAANIDSSAPTKTIDLSTGNRYQSMTVAQSDFVGYTGNWYVYNPTSPVSSTHYAFTVADPTLSIAFWDFQQGTNVDGIAGTSGTDVTGKVVPQGEHIGVQIYTNMYSAVDTRFRSSLIGGVYSPLDSTRDGFITLKVSDENGAVFSKLIVGNATSSSSVGITGLYVDTQPYFFGSSDKLGTAPGYWVTDALDTSSNQYAYPVGTYKGWAESKLNNMKDNYKNAGSDYTGKTVSGTGTLTLTSNTVKIEANKDSVVRSKPFSITVTGKPSTTYYLWVKNTNTMDGKIDNQPPMINLNQEMVDSDTNAAPYSWPIGSYKYENSGANTIRTNVATDAINVADNSTRYYGLIHTTSSGTRTVEFATTNWTKAQKYTIRVEQNFPVDINGLSIGGYTTPRTGAVKSDEVDVQIEKGAVTIVATGDQSYYLGEEIKFSGTNTESYKTYLFIMGPNLPLHGAEIQGTNPRSDKLGHITSSKAGVEDGVSTSFKSIDVNGDNTWSWKWGTSTVALDAGTYTIYAVSQPRDAQNLANTAFGTVSIIIKKPFVSATASQSTVAQGDKIFISGTAQGNPIGVKIWILGKNYPQDINGVVDASVNTDASFKYEIKQATTKTLYPGQYFVVVQHPMQNNVFDVVAKDDGTGTGTVNVVNLQLNAASTTATAGTKVFTLLGAGSLQGSDAAEALVQGINDPNVDDTYTKLQFLVEVPVIRIDPVGDKHVGDKFTITASTNLAVDDEVLVQVYSSSFKPTQKSQSGEFSGATGTVKVTRGDSGMNKLWFDVDSSTFKPDEYIITEDAILQTCTATALFNVLDGTTPAVTATPVVTSTEPVVTTVETVVTTVLPTPTPTKSPGYGALIALIGLGAVAFIIVRRH
ncbi:MAG: MEMAR_RS02690 family S-layer glycoprotein [Methanoregula sp.]